jgi:hypothetical protein
VPKLDEGTSSTAELGQPAPAGYREELVKVPKVPGTESAEAPKHAIEAKGKVAEEPGVGAKAKTLPFARSLRQSRCTKGGKTTGGAHPSSSTLQDEGLR